MWWFVPACSDTSVVSDSATPWNVALQALLSVGFPSKNTGVSCHALLQRIFPTQRLNIPLCVSSIAGRFFITWATRGAPSWPNHVPKAPPPNTIMLGRLQYMNWGEGREWNTSIPSIAHTKKVSPRGSEDQIYSLLEKTPLTAKLAPEVGLFSRYSFWGNTTRNQCYVNSDQTSHPPHQGFLMTSKQKWQRTTFSTFSKVNSLCWLFWDHFQCNLKILTFANWEKTNSVISLSPGSNI